MWHASIRAHHPIQDPLFYYEVNIAINGYGVMKTCHLPEEQEQMEVMFAVEHLE